MRNRSACGFKQIIAPLRLCYTVCAFALERVRERESKGGACATRENLPRRNLPVVIPVHDLVPVLDHVVGVSHASRAGFHGRRDI